MHKKDYIQRQFEEFGKVLASLLTSKKNQDWEKFEKELNDAAQKYTSLEISVIEALSQEDFETQMTASTLPYDQKKILANLLFEKMNFHLEKDGKEKYSNLKRKCLSLYLQLTEDLTQNEYDLEVHYRRDLLTK